MAPVRTTFRKETPDNIEYGEAILVALKLKAERQLEVIAPDQQDNLLVLCRLVLGYTGRPRKAQSGAMAAICVPDDEAPDSRKRNTCQTPPRLTTQAS